MPTADKNNIRLSQEDRDHIRAEEIYRDEVRAQIATDKGLPKLHQRLWASRNSAFTLWLLSSVVLATISWSYAQWEVTRSAQRNAEMSFKEFANQAASAMDGLQEAIIAHRSIVEQYLQGNIRKVGRLHYRFAMMDIIEEGLKNSSNININLKKLQRHMGDAGSRARSDFQIWTEYSVGNDVDSREKTIENLIKRRLLKNRETEDYVQALAHRGEKIFIFVEEAIKWKVFLELHGNKITHLTGTVSRNTSDLRSAAEGFEPIHELKPWLGEITAIVGDIADSDAMIKIYSAIESGYSARLRLGGSEDFLESTRLEDVMDIEMRKEIIFGLTQLSLSDAKLKRVYQETENARINLIKSSLQRLSTAINAAEELHKAVMAELVILKSGSWSENLSEIPWLTQTLNQRTQFSLALNDTVPDDILNLEKEAKTEISQSMIFLERILERANNR